VSVGHDDLLLITYVREELLDEGWTIDEVQTYLTKMDPGDWRKYVGDMTRAHAAELVETLR
jgi:hypothetical protein